MSDGTIEEDFEAALARDGRAGRRAHEADLPPQRRAVNSVTASYKARAQSSSERHQYALTHLL